MNATGSSQGFLETAAQKTGLTGFVQKLNISKAMVIEIGIYVGVGFVAGFLLKRFSKAFLVLVLLILTLWFLNHMELLMVTINWQRIQEVIFGSYPIPFPANNDFGAFLWSWITMHMAGSISFVLGFLAGIRLG